MVYISRHLPCVQGAFSCLRPDTKSSVEKIELSGLCQLTEGREWIESKTGLPVLGVIPYIEHQLEEHSFRDKGKNMQFNPHLNEAEYEKLASHIESYLDVDRLLQIMGGASS